MGRFAWYHPLESPEANFRAGRKRKILDIFGPWVPVQDLNMEETEPDAMQSVMQPANKVLAWDFEPITEEADAVGQVIIPFHVFDHILEEHRVDFTGLTYSSTKRGNLYRTRRLMLPAA